MAYSATVFSSTNVSPLGTVTAPQVVSTHTIEDQALFLGCINLASQSLLDGQNSGTVRNRDWHLRPYKRFDNDRKLFFEALLLVRTAACPHQRVVCLKFFPAAVLNFRPGPLASCIIPLFKSPRPHFRLLFPFSSSQNEQRKSKSFHGTALYTRQDYIL
jgi:hypothetical protein